MFLTVRLVTSIGIVLAVWLRYDWVLALVLTGMTCAIELQFWALGALTLKVDALQRQHDTHMHANLTFKAPPTKAES